MTYLEWVKTYPLFSAFLQFAVLGTFGEVVSHWFRNKKVTFPFSFKVLLLKGIAWAVLGIMIKYGFVAMRGAVDAMLEHNLLPHFLSQGLFYAFSVSVMTNLFFGPQMMFIHRLEDNAIDRKWNMVGLERAWLTLLWFWIPAHTVTFALPKDYQIGLAAIWSVVLGVIMGLSNRPKTIDPFAK